MSTSLANPCAVDQSSLERYPCHIQMMYRCCCRIATIVSLGIAFARLNKSPPSHCAVFKTWLDIESSKISRRLYATFNHMVFQRLQLQGAGDAA